MSRLSVPVDLRYPPPRSLDLVDGAETAAGPRGYSSGGRKERLQQFISIGEPWLLLLSKSGLLIAIATLASNSIAIDGPRDYITCCDKNSSFPANRETLLHTQKYSAGTSQKLHNNTYE